MPWPHGHLEITKDRWLQSLQPSFWIPVGRGRDGVETLNLIPIERRCRAISNFLHLLS